ncbi:hypothetical protein ScPMuIL_004194 [Solemya velum]
MELVIRLTFIMIWLVTPIVSQGTVKGLCPESFGVGYVLDDCFRDVKDECEFECAPFHRRTGYGPKVRCTQTGEWEAVAYSGETNDDVTVLCYPEGSRCSSRVIENGYMDAECIAASGVQCSYECRPGFFPRTTTSTVTCNGQASHEEWSPPLEELCYEGCTRLIPNGYVVDTCISTEGASCSYDCNIYFKRATLGDKMKCKYEDNELVWGSDTATLCKRITCEPLDIQYGHLADTCRFYANIPCNYECVDAFEKVGDVETITCLPDEDGEYGWNHARVGLCQKETPSEAIIWIGVGLGVGVVVITSCALVCCAVRNHRRKQRALHDVVGTHDNADRGTMMSNSGDTVVRPTVIVSESNVDVVPPITTEQTHPDPSAPPWQPEYRDSPTSNLNTDYRDQSSPRAPIGPHHSDSSLREPRNRDSSPRQPRHRDSSPRQPRYRDSSPREPRHKDSSSREPRHRDSSTREPRHRDSSPRQPRHRDSSPRLPMRSHYSRPWAPPSVRDPRDRAEPSAPPINYSISGGDLPPPSYESVVKDTDTMEISDQYKPGHS